jgi:hypothetical protein
VGTSVVLVERVNEILAVFPLSEPVDRCALLGIHIGKGARKVFNDTASEMESFVGPFVVFRFEIWSQPWQDLEVGYRMLDFAGPRPLEVHTRQTLVAGAGEAQLVLSG